MIVIARNASSRSSTFRRVGAHGSIDTSALLHLLVECRLEPAVRRQTSRSARPVPASTSRRNGTSSRAGRAESDPRRPSKARTRAVAPPASAVRAAVVILASAAWAAAACRSSRTRSRSSTGAASSPRAGDMAYAAPSGSAIGRSAIHLSISASRQPTVLPTIKRLRGKSPALLEPPDARSHGEPRTRHDFGHAQESFRHVASDSSGVARYRW